MQSPAITQLKRRRVGKPDKRQRAINRTTQERGALASVERDAGQTNVQRDSKSSGPEMLGGLSTEDAAFPASRAHMQPFQSTHPFVVAPSQTPPMQRVNVRWSGPSHELGPTTMSSVPSSYEVQPRPHQQSFTITSDPTSNLTHQGTLRSGSGNRPSTCKSTPNYPHEYVVSNVNESSSVTSRSQLPHLINQPWPPITESGVPPSLTIAPSSTNIGGILGKRKVSEVELGEHSALKADNVEVVSEASRPQPESVGLSAHNVRIKRESTTYSVVEKKPDVPISILPLPLPSKRFKKKPTSKTLLIPAEQLPVFPLPPLPIIQDAKVLKQVFTHISLYQRTRGRFEEPEEDPLQHYEKLEHVGDSLLGMIVTTWLHEIRSRLTCGTATKLKAHLVSNATLSHISGLYNLPQRLIADPNLLPVLRAQTDVRAALMEAYIAGLYFTYPPNQRISTALPILDTWLREMYEPLYDFFLTYMKTEWDQHNAVGGTDVDGSVVILSEEEMARIDNAAMGMAPLVQMYAHKRGREIRWEDEKLETNVGAVWRMKCYIDGIELGEGMRANKKTAKNLASWEAAKKLGLSSESVSL